MNTRSFIKSLLVASVAPSVLVPVLKDRFRWKLNPEWEAAPLEGMTFNTRDFAGTWVFMYQNDSGLWLRDTPTGPVPCFQPQRFFGGSAKPWLEWHGPTDEVTEVIFHRRENA